MASDSEHKRKTQEENVQPSGGVSLARRSFLTGAAAGAVTLALPRWASASDGSSFAGLSATLEDDFSAIRAEITKRHDESVQRLQTWMKQPSIAAENRGMNEGCDLTMQMLRE